MIPAHLGNSDGFRRGDHGGAHHIRHGRLVGWEPACACRSAAGGVIGGPDEDSGVASTCALRHGADRRRLPVRRRLRGGAERLTGHEGLRLCFGRRQPAPGHLPGESPRRCEREDHVARSGCPRPEDRQAAPGRQGRSCHIRHGGDRQRTRCLAGVREPSRTPGEGRRLLPARARLPRNGEVDAPGPRRGIPRPRRVDPAPGDGREAQDASAGCRSIRHEGHPRGGTGLQPSGGRHLRGPGQLRQS